MDVQAAELAELLYARQSELDRREAELEANRADLEREVREAQLWIEERQREFSAADAQREVEKQAKSRTGSADVDRASIEQALAVREVAVARFEEEIGERRQELEQQAAALDADRQALSECQRKIAARAEELEARHCEIDTRKAQLYQDIERFSSERVRLADQQHAIDAGRDELRQQADDFDRREAEFERREARLARQMGELDAAHAEITRLIEDHEQQAADLEAREEQLAFRAREIETALARFKRLGVTEVKMRQLQEETQSLEARRAFLDQAEALLTAEQDELATGRQELESLRLMFHQETERERRRMATERENVESEFATEHRRLERRQQEADRRETALEQLQAELAHSQREGLEMRLATEEIFSQLAGALAPASLSRSIAQTRAKLADSYRVREDELSQREQQLEHVRNEVAVEHEKLVRKRAELDAWIRRRQQEIEEQAARLVAREQELDRQESHFAQLERSWCDERSEYQREIRRLLAALRTPTAAAA
jgi:chromosome segregation ATPase